MKDSELAGNAKASDMREPDTRYAMLQKTFFAAKKADPYSPTAPTLIARRFEEDREIPEARVKGMLEQVVTSPLVAQTAKTDSSRVWAVRSSHLTSGTTVSVPAAHTPKRSWMHIVAKRYPSAEAYQKDIPNLLDEAGLLARAGAISGQHTLPWTRRAAPAMPWARGCARRKPICARVIDKNGMDYKGFNVAVHEMGHNVEQTFSLNDVDHTLLHRRPQHGIHRGIRLRLPGTRSGTAGPARLRMLAARRREF